MKSSGRYRRWLLIMMGLALCLRVGAAAAWQVHLGGVHEFGFPDSHGYWYLARHIARGEPYEHGGPEFQVFRAPAYPVMLATLFRLVGDNPPVFWARVLGAVLGTLAVGGIAWIARVLFDERTSLVAGFLAACYPGAIGMSVFILSEALFAPLMVVQLGCWIGAWRAASRGYQAMGVVATGMAGGLATLARPSWLLFTPFAIVLAVTFSRHRKRHALFGLRILLILSVTMVPWWIRNYRVTGTFVPTTLQLGASLYDGLNPRATGASDMRFADRFHGAQKRDDASRGRSAEGFEVRLDRRLRDAALAWANAHRRDVVRLMGRKFLRMWSPWLNAAELRDWKVRLVVATAYIPLVLLGLVGAVRFVPRGWSHVLCAMPAVYFTLLHLVFVSSIRYRQPAMLVGIVLGAGVLGQWMKKVRGAACTAHRVRGDVMDQ